MGNAGSIEEYEYAAGTDPAPPSWSGYGEVVAPHPPADRPSIPQMEQRMVEETRRSFEAGRQRGLLEGEQAEREAQCSMRAAEQKQRAEKAAALLRAFAEGGESYFQAVEQEVVELALAVAARVLRREAQMDPLMLTGAVRVALGQLQGSTEVKLQVPAAELELWKTAIALIPNLALKPTVTAGEDMRLGDCRIETVQGSVDLGVRSQLGEIERGFFDRSPGSRIKAIDTLESIPAGACS